MGRMWVLLPCYNEEAALPGLLARLQTLFLQLNQGESHAGTEANGMTILVVDDGSTDATACIAQSAVKEEPELDGLTVSLLQHERNLGLGAAMRTGISHFLSHAAPADWLAVLDADGTHPPERLADMMRAARQRSLEMVIASRYAPGGGETGLSTSRRLCSRLCSWGLGVLFRIPGVRDYTSGFRLYSATALQRAAAHYGANLLRERSFACQAELLLHLARTGARIGEVPLVLRYGEKRGRSKMRVLPTIWRYTVMTLQELVDRRVQRSRGEATR